VPKGRIRTFTTFKQFGEIALRSIDADDKSAVWTVEDLSAFGEAFKESLELKVSPGCIDFYVVVCPRNKRVVKSC